MAKVDNLSVNAGVSTSGSNRVAYSNVIEEQTDASLETAARVWLKKNPDQLDALKDGTTYHIVRAAYLAEGIAYDISTDFAGMLGGEARVRGMANVKLDLMNATSGNRYRMSVALTPPLRVCIRAKPIGVVASGSGGEQELGVFDEDSVLPAELILRKR